MTAMKITKTEANYSARGTTRYYIDDAALKAEAIALAESFPKSARVGIMMDVAVEQGERSRKFYYLAFDVKLAADAANGGKNETGMKRIATFEKAAAKLGIELV